MNVRLSANVKPVAHALLQARLDGLLNNPDDVYGILKKTQPASGLSGPEWEELSPFIEGLQHSNKESGARQVAARYDLDLEY